MEDVIAPDPMSRTRVVASGLASALLSFFVVHAAGCGTDAVGVDECRDIEEARCEAGKYCGLVDDVDTCKRFYRDQCLHGLAAGERPGAPRVRDCVEAIQAAGECAKNGAKTVADCAAFPTKTYHTEICDVVTEPEGAQACEFLYKPVEVPDATPDVSPDTTPDAAGDAPDTDAADAAPE